jgi:hypothetical protein
MKRQSSQLETPGMTVSGFHHLGTLPLIRLTQIENAG